MAADAVYKNGVIYTMEEGQPTASAIAVRGQDIVYVGDDVGAQAFVGVNTQGFDLEGRTVVPGFNDAHLHLDLIGEQLNSTELYLKNMTRDQMLTAVEKKILELEKVKATDPSNWFNWISGYGWAFGNWPEGQSPTAAELDALAGGKGADYYMYFTGVDYHSAWVNGRVMAAAKIDFLKDMTAEEIGGTVYYTPSGDFSGVFTDNARNYLEPAKQASDVVVETIDKNSAAYQTDLLLDAQQNLLSNGITSFTHAGALDTDLLASLISGGAFKIRAYVTPDTLLLDSDSQYNPAQKFGDYFASDSALKGRLIQRGAKIFEDGAMNSRSAWLFKEYTDDPGNTGAPIYTEAQLKELFTRAVDRDVQVMIHSIGDRANHTILSVWEEVLREHGYTDANIGDNPYRLRIEHFQIAAPEDFAYAAKLGVIASVQMNSVAIGKTADMRLGTERGANTYAFKKFLDNGVVLANGTDAPITSTNPFIGLWEAVTRTTADGTVWNPQEIISREEALKSYTLTSAYVQFEEDAKGSLKVGKYADFVILDTDYMTCDAAKIKDIKILTTVVGGDIALVRAQAPADILSGKPADAIVYAE